MTSPSDTEKRADTSPEKIVGQAATIRPKRAPVTRREHLRLARKYVRLMLEHLWAAIRGK